MKKRVILLVMVLSVFSALISVNAQTIKTFEVTNTDDSGPGSLRAAVEAANISTADSNRIVFAFEESGSHVINIDTTIILNASHTAIDGSTTKDSVIIEGKGEDFDGILVPLYGGHSLTNVYLNKINVRNCSDGVVFLGTCGVVIENCAFMYNYIGVNLKSACALVKKSLISGNSYAGVSYSSVSFTGVSDIGCEGKMRLQDNIIGLSSDMKTKIPNGEGVGLHGIDGEYYSFEAENNVIAGNEGVGIDMTTSYLNNIKISKNYIGVNRSFEDFGNGGDGIHFSYGVSVSGSTPVVGGFTTKDSANFIGFNKGNGISGYVPTYNNYVGVTPDYKPMPNELDGISLIAGTCEGNMVGYNKGNGITVNNGQLNNNIIGGDGVHDFPNEGYGIFAKKGNVIGNRIFNNASGGLYYTQSMYGLQTSQNLFSGENQPFAINDRAYIYPPVITSVKRVNGDIIVSGTVKFNDMTFSAPYTLDNEKVGIELFLSEGEQSAIEYLGYTESNSEGEWSITLPKYV